MRYLITLISLMTLPALASPTFAQKAVLKDGRVIECRNCRVIGEKLSCEGTDGREVTILLAELDSTRTRELNEKESKPPLNAPEQIPTARTETCCNGQESLGDLARRAGQGQKAKISNHVFTDDDVVHGQPSGADVPSVGPADLKGKIATTRAIVDRMADKRPRELSEAVVGEIKFPGRDDWEQRLFRQTGAMLSAARSALDALQMQLNASTQEQRTNAGKAATRLYWDFGLEKSSYDRLVAEGVKKAADWERHR
jgi:hypothetical protein